MQKIRALKFNELAKLVYRDSVEQKHQDRSRLALELVNGAVAGNASNVPSKMKLKTIADTSVPTAPLAEALLKHLIEVPCLRC